MKSKLPRPQTLFATAILAGAIAVTHGQTTPPDFTRDIQPILEKSCLPCHGEKLQSGKLRLDSREAIAHVIVPGKSADSEIYKRVAGLGTMARMPMGGKLSDSEIALIAKWIDAGANWPASLTLGAAKKAKHWAFIPPQRPALPAVSHASWATNDIDRFILAKLDAEGLQPSPEADRATLLRRASLDLIGLPPSSSDLDVFLADRSPRAYEKQIDRLLASPHYGERWARGWLDAARYADSDGYEKDKPRSVWFYRDWVINAFNKDLPYDRFVISQIAGDLMPDKTQDSIVATGFLRNSMVNEEGGIDPEQFRMEAMFDRMEAIGKGILGITIQCAQCHNHKYDPLTQEEYYRMFAFLNNSHEANVAVYTPAELQKRAEIQRRTREIEASMQHRSADWQSRMLAWEATTDKTQWTVITPDVDDISTGGQKYIPQEDGSLLAQGYAPTKHTVKLTAKTSMKNITAIRLELLTDPNLPLNGPGRSVKGTGALSEFEVEVAGKKVPIAKATADLNLPEAPLDPMFDDKKKVKRVIGPIEFAIDGKHETAWGTDAGPGLRNQARKAVFTLAEPIQSDGETQLVIKLAQEHGGWNSDDNQNNNLGRIRLSITSDPNASADPIPAAVREIMAIPSERRSPSQLQAEFSYWRTTQPQWKDENETIAKLWQTYPEGSEQLVLSERKRMRETYQLTRGSFLTPGKVVQPGTPSFLNPLPNTGNPGRLEFAKWMVDRQSPTTARALVNRLWQAYFGTGIVETSEDLGLQAAAPSHPELLDWLAVELMENGWSVKHIQKLIVMSSAYRQSSNVTPEMLSKDPYNRLISRGARFRVDAEIVRDIALSSSGLLNDKVGGESVTPPAPAFLFLPPTSYGPKVWVDATGPDRYRRALYTFRFRSVPYPMLQVFDAPNGDSSCVRRSRSNTPLQALTTLNEPLFLDAARALALRTVKEGGDADRARMDSMFRWVLSRPTHPAEQEELLRLLSRETDHFSSANNDPWEFAASDPAHKPDLPNGITPARLAAWTAVSRVVLNLDETITKE